MSSIVEVKLELGHRAKVREIQHPDGYTHDWVVFVKGINGIKIEHFVEKVVFWLHDSYEPNKVVLKQPPYKVEQSGFAGFNMLIYVHFRNREEPKMVRFEYDLFLHTELMPPVNHTRLEKLTFTNPTEDFRKKLLQAGAQLINQNSDASKHRSTSKDRSGGVISPVSKKEKSRSNSKRSSSHSKKDAARIPGKDIKRHDENFKQPLPAKTGKESDSGNSKSNIQQERGRSEKRRSVADDDDAEVGRKKKKKRSEDFSSKSPSMSSASNQQKKDKERIRKIKEKADVVAGLFAPENSINMTQIKKEKIKQEDSKIIKKEKTPNRTPTRTVPSPHPTTENAQHTSKISPGGNLTLKIKKERITSGEKEKKFSKESSNTVTKRRDSLNKEKRKHKDASSKAKSNVEKIKVEMKRSPLTSDSSSSDMDISESESSNDEKHERNKIRTSPAKFHNTSKRVEKVESKIKSINTSKASESKSSKNSLKTELQNKSESDRSFKDSPGHSKHSEKEKHKDTYTNKKSSSSKHKKSTKERENTPTANKESSKQKKQKRSSKEKLVKQPTKEAKMSTPPVKEELSSTPNNVRSNPKKLKNDYPSPGGVILDNASPVVTNKPKKSSSSPKPSNRSKKKEIIITKKSSSKKHSSKNDSRHEEKAKPVYKSRSFVETSSDDSDLEFPPPAPEPRKKTYPKISPIRKDSVSSQSSAYSEVHSNIISEDEKPPPAPTKITSHSSSSDSSEDEMEMSGFPSGNSSKISVISPIGERSPSNTENTIDATQAYQDMQMSSSSDESPFHEHMDSEKHTHHPSDDVNNQAQESNRILKDLGFSNDLNTSSSDEEPSSPLEKPFQNRNDVVDAAHHSENPHQEEHESSPSQNPELPNVLICEGNNQYPDMNDTLYQELQELQKKLSFVTDVNRLRKIAAIVAKSQKLLRNEEYFDFDLCSLDQRTISKIQKQLKAV